MPALLQASTKIRGTAFIMLFCPSVGEECAMYILRTGDMSQQFFSIRKNAKYPDFGIKGRIYFCDLGLDMKTWF